MIVGNMVFASHNSLKRVSLSRRDDLISTCYFLTFLLDGEHSWEREIEHLEWSNYFLKASQIKKSMTPEKLCVGNS
jgi:hypothetical protein